MNDAEIKRRVLRHSIAILAQELKRILEENFGKDPKLVEKELERARSFRQAIESYGFLVIVTSVLNPETLKIEVLVEVLEPKQNMTPEERKIYNDWFAKANNLPSI